MSGSGFYTRPQWLTDEHIAHPYMTLADGSQVDAVRNLDKSGPYPDTGWVGVILANCDEVPLQEMGEQELQAVTGQPVSGRGGG
jgi:hypothetical protein